MKEEDEKEKENEENMKFKDDLEKFSQGVDSIHQEALPLDQDIDNARNKREYYSNSMLRRRPERRGNPRKRMHILTRGTTLLGHQGISQGHFTSFKSYLSG